MNTSLLSLRAYNFFYFSLLSIFISFLPVYLSFRGVTPAQIGVLIGAGSFIGILSQPFWGMVSDRTKTIKRVILVTLGLSIVSGIALFTTTPFFALFLLVGAMYFFLLPTDPLTESLNYRMAEQHRTSFGSIRTFGAVGYATASLFIGWTLDRLGMEQLVWLFVGYGVLAYLCALAMKDAPASSKPLSWPELKRFFLYPKTQRFFLLVLIAATPHRTNDSFLGVYVQSLGGTTGDVGQAWFLAAVSEVAFFAISARILARWSEIRLIMLASALYAIRYVLCALAPSPEWVVYLQLTQGVTFVIFYTATIQYLYKIIPEEWRATGQTVLAVLFFGISGIIGSLLGGWLFQQSGGAALYWAMGICSAVAFVYSLMLASSKSSVGGAGM
ncbi:MULTISPECIES: MFS transporter [Brevibacillus]|mgnify:FL=1|uniref:Putative transporter YwbF n=1 Tax=Brevibacillus parabrevis TaxID=54914 RepID=A0A4Y3PJD1_BREPA|nr:MULTISPECIES: MFS transporter [Brevibacillus]MED2256321.1 MFS transporter [Brevibacillus parabrevis]RNB96915.1 MFS transporter [Brevibacillus parabrevis]UED70644.1 MFS transporter [Brevibacillus sp. HD3.3A]WDV96941.1 MFS transporter [Brevibacillus parabrevis]GEB33544.1 putative transporter YwbF [Brevibacillus parabrevis]